MVGFWIYYIFFVLIVMALGVLSIRTMFKKKKKARDRYEKGETNKDVVKRVIACLFLLTCCILISVIELVPMSKDIVEDKRITITGICSKDDNSSGRFTFTSRKAFTVNGDEIKLTRLGFSFSSVDNIDFTLGKKYRVTYMKNSKIIIDAKYV